GNRALPVPPVADRRLGRRPDRHALDGRASRLHRMDDDWRLQINLEDEGKVGEIADHLRSSELEHELSTDLGKRVILSHEGETIYLYAGDRDQLERARP